MPRQYFSWRIRSCGMSLTRSATESSESSWQSETSRRCSRGQCVLMCFRERDVISLLLIAKFCREAPAVLSASASTASSSSPATAPTRSSRSSVLCAATARKTSTPETRLQKVRSSARSFAQAASSSTTGLVSSFQKPRRLSCSSSRQCARPSTASLPSLRQPLRSTTLRVLAQPWATASMAGERTCRQSARTRRESRGRRRAYSSRLPPSRRSSAPLASSRSSVGARGARRCRSAASSSSGTFRRTTALG
mmetsp:Transcript_108178/g.349243  ORF Transcript_108178/g.349243 Transcript_108178/m.349243 type:complete len:251 (-) Transcript_108178:209-961(-)